MTVAISPLRSLAPAVATPIRPAAQLLRVFLRRWPARRRPLGSLLALVSELNRCGWRCAVVDGSEAMSAWRLLTSSGQNARVQVRTIAEGLQHLQQFQQSGVFDLVILHRIPCSLERVRNWLAWTDGRGAVLWLRHSEAVLLEEEASCEPVWLRRAGNLLDRFLHLLDRWGA